MTLTLQDHVAAVLADPLAAARSARQPLGFVGADLPPELALGSEHARNLGLGRDVGDAAHGPGGGEPGHASRQSKSR